MVKYIRQIFVGVLLVIQEPKDSKLAAERCNDPWAFQVIGRLIVDRLGQTEAAEATHRRGLDCVTETLEAELRS